VQLVYQDTTEKIKDFGSTNTLLIPRKRADKMGRKDKEPKKNDFEDMKRDQKLQAILLADSFKKTFRPMTYESPKALMPLVNVPMIMYTIEFLAQNGVEEVSDRNVFFLFKFCRSYCVIVSLTLLYAVLLDFYFLC
jgi:hypothetical protein